MTANGSLASNVPEILTLKIIMSSQLDLPINQLDAHVEIFSTDHDMLTRLKLNDSSKKIVVCRVEQLPTLQSSLMDDSIHCLIAVGNGDELDECIYSKCNKIQLVKDEKQLMRYLSMESMLCFAKEALKHKQQGDIGIANLYYNQALQSLSAAKDYI